MKKKVSIIIIITLLFNLFMGCNLTKKTKQETVTISFATFFDTDAEELIIYKNIAKEYEKEHKNISIKVIASPEQKAVEDSISEKGDIDLVGLKRTQFIEYSKSGYLMDITDIDGMKELKEKIYNICTLYGTYNGKQYGIGDMPLSSEWIYNVDIFNKYNIKEPTNLNELIILCKNLKDKDIIPLEIGALDSWTLTMLMGAITCQNVNMNSITSAYGGDSKAYENISGMNSCFDYYYRLVSNCTVKKSLDINYRQSIDDFVKGKCAIIFGGSWTIKQLDALKQANFNYQVFDTPIKIVDNPLSNISSSGGQIISIAANTKNQKESVNFLKYIFSPEAQKNFKTKGYISSLINNDNEQNQIKIRITKHLLETNNNSIMFIDSIKPDMAENLGRVLQDIIEDRVKTSEGWQRILKQTFK